MKRIDLTNRRFGKLLVISLSESKDQARRWLCRCDCGRECHVCTHALTSGNTKSCSHSCGRGMGIDNRSFTGIGEIHGKFWGNIRRGAEIRKIPFNISIEEAWNLFLNQKRKCALTGIELKFAKTTRDLEKGSCTASLDRIDSRQEYCLSNVQWVHKDINLMKQGYSQNYFINLCRKVYEHGSEYHGCFFEPIKEFNYQDVCLLPNRTVVGSRKECNVSAKLGKRTFALPVYPANMKSVVSEDTCKYLAKNNIFYTMHRFGIDSVKFIESMKQEGLFSSISLGVKPESKKELLRIKEHNLCLDYITFDVANAWSPASERMIKEIKNTFPEVYLIAGNVATEQAIVELESWGVDAIKVGVAGGHVCITRDKTGFHRPMISTIKSCANVATVPIIADGGIYYNGDISKALACGASMVMAGHLFSGYDESAGNIIEIEGKYYKDYYGSASEFNKQEKINIEGKKILVDYKGSMDKLLKELKEDLQSAVSYAGGADLSALKQCKMICIK